MYFLWILLRDKRQKRIWTSRGKNIKRKRTGRLRLATKSHVRYGARECSSFFHRPSPCLIPFFILLFSYHFFIILLQLLLYCFYYRSLDFPPENPNSQYTSPLLFPPIDIWAICVLLQFRFNSTDTFSIYFCKSSLFRLQKLNDG